MEKSEEEIRTRLRKQALMFSIVYGLIWVSEFIISEKSGLGFIQHNHPLGLSQLIIVKAVCAIWIYRKSKRLKIEPFTWIIFCLFTPIITFFLIGISKDNESDSDL